MVALLFRSLVTFHRAACSNHNGMWKGPHESTMNGTLFSKFYAKIQTVTVTISFLIVFFLKFWLIDRRNVVYNVKHRPKILSFKYRWKSDIVQGSSLAHAVATMTEIGMP